MATRIVEVYWGKMVCLLDNYTMYQVVLGALLWLVLFGFLAGWLQYIPYSLSEQMWSLAVVLLVMISIHQLIAVVTRIPAHMESTIITSLIIYFLITPAFSWWGLHYIALAGSIAVIAKYLFVYRRQHIANPAAIGVMVLSLSGYYEVTWWIGSPALFIPLLIAGIAVVQKVRKWEPVIAFVGIGFLVFLYEEWQFFGHIDNWSMFWVSYPALFLAFFMLTEPFSIPPTKKLQIWYGALVGFLAHTTLLAPLVKMTPEFALVIGNVLFYPATTRQKLFLKLIEKQLIARDTYEFVFSKPHAFSFQAGQYLEWMLPHKGSDARGSRRYFTIASSPHEAVVRVACKILPSHGSSYKNALQVLQPGDELIASQRAGDFLLPTPVEKKIAWIAGGIGVTPFVSQWRFLEAQQATVDVAFFYCVQSYADAAYEQLFKNPTIEKLSYIPVLAQETPRLGDESGFITIEMIQRRVPDWSERIWYLSGPPGMVTTYRQLLRSLGVPRRSIVTDFFPGIG